MRVREGNDFPEHLNCPSLDKVWRSAIFAFDHNIQLPDSRIPYQSWQLNVQLPNQAASQQTRPCQVQWVTLVGDHLPVPWLARGRVMVMTMMVRPDWKATATDLLEWQVKP